MKASSLVPLTAGLLASLLAIGCSSTGDAGDGSDPATGAAESAEASEDELRASCTNPRRYFVTYREGTGSCEPIAGRRGQWLPEALFADAPEDVQASTCIYVWSGEKYSRPDGDALANEVGPMNGLAPACGPTPVPEVGQLQPIDVLDVWTLVGSVGCDVCGVLRKGRLWVILPPDKIVRKQFQVQLSNGDTRAFQIAPTDARALSIRLPAAPRGTSYQQGRVQIYCGGVGCKLPAVKNVPG